MHKHFQRFWTLYAVVMLYVGSVLKMMSGGTQGTELQPDDMPQGGLDVVSMVFTAIFLVGFRSCMNAQLKDSQGHEKE